MRQNPPPLLLKNRELCTELPAFVMSIINCTPDSFWIGSRFLSATKDGIQPVVEYILKQCEYGADIIDIGGESSRPGSEYVSANQELERIIPLIEAVRKHSQVAISVDTRKSVVLKEALRFGADILNDISALEDDEQIVKVVAAEKIPVILMHKRFTPLSMQQNTVYNDIILEVVNYLSERAMYASTNGVEDAKIILDAGIGFAKDTPGNIILIKNTEIILKNVKSLNGLNIFGMAVGLSRKSCVGDMTGQCVENRLAGSIAANLLAVQCGARILRVHDTSETVDMLRVLKSLDI